MRMSHLVVAAGVLLLVTGCGVEAADDSAAVRGREDGRAELDCLASEQMAFDLDVPGPGTSTPERAVAPLADGPTAVVEETQRAARVHELGEDDALVKIFNLTRHQDGWWPDSYTECAG